MLELNDLIMLGILSAFFSGAFAVFFTILAAFLWHNNFESRLRSCEGRLARESHGQVKLDKQQKINLAMLRAKELHDQGTPTMQIASTIAVEYPEVAFDALRQLKKLAGEMGVDTEGL